MYAAAFSFAYLYLDTATGALILFACVQITMISYSLFKGMRPGKLEWLGIILSFGGFIYLLLPGLEAPSLIGAVLMAISGIAWGIYSIRGTKSVNAITDTTGNFLKSTPILLLLLPSFFISVHATPTGYILAILSGTVTSGLGYAVWYYVLPNLKSTVAAISQLSVPVFAAFGGVFLLDEMISLRLIVASIAILGGITLVTAAKHKN